MLGSTVVSGQGVQKGAEHTALWCARVEDQQEGGVAADSHHLGPVHQEVEYPAADGVSSPRSTSLETSFEGVMELNGEL